MKVEPLWRMTKDWAGRIVLYAQAVQKIHEEVIFGLTKFACFDLLANKGLYACLV